MPFTNFPHGITSFGVPVFGGMADYTGDVRYLVANKTTDAFFLMLQARGIPDYMMFTNPQTAHDACTSGQNDTVLAFPGVYNMYTLGNAALTWSKNNTHLIAAYPPTEYDNQVRISASGAATPTTTMKITSKESRFYGFNVTSSAQATTSKALVLGDGVAVTTLHNYFKKVGMAGGNHATGAGGTTGVASLYLDGTSGNFFEDCQIGASITRRTAANQQVYLNTTGNINNTFFRCKFHSWTNQSDFVMVRHGGEPAMDRLTLFDNCVFYNFFGQAGAKAGAVFYMPVTTTAYHVILHACGQYGHTQWLLAGSGTTQLVSDMPSTAAGGAGGTCLVAT